jgi:hypothetical protein
MITKCGSAATSSMILAVTNIYRESCRHGIFRKPGPENTILCKWELRYNPAVPHVYRPMAKRGGFRIVRDHQDGLPQPPVQIP